MNHLALCSGNLHEKDPNDKFCITCHISIIQKTIINPHEYVFESEQLYELKSLEESLTILEQGIQINSSIEDTYNKIGEALKNLQKDSDAYLYFQKGNEIKKSSLELLKLKSKILTELQRFKEALNCIELIQEIVPEIMYWQKAELSHKLNKTDEAIQIIERALQYDTENKKTLQIQKGFGSNIIIGVLLQSQKKYEEAITCYNEALKIVPQDLEAFIAMGSALREQGKYDEAINWCDAALNINRLSVEALNNKGLTLNQLCQYEKSLECYDFALNINPYCIDTLNNKGTTLKMLGRYEEAIQCQDAALNINPLFKDALNNKGDVFHHFLGNTLIDNYVLLKQQNNADLKRSQNAIMLFYIPILRMQVYYLKKVMTCPQFLGSTLQELGKCQEALEQYNAALESNPKLEEILNKKGTALHQLGRYDEAIECYDVALQINPKYYEVFNNKGHTLTQQKKCEQAQKCYNAASRIHQQCKQSRMPQNFDDAEVNPEYAQAFFGQQGSTLKQLSKQEEAIQWYIDTQQLLPKTPTILKNNFITFQNALLLEVEVVNLEPEIIINSEQKQSQKEDINSFDNHLSNETSNQHKQFQNEQDNNLEKLIIEGTHLLEKNEFQEALRVLDEILTFNQSPEFILVKGIE